MPILPGECGFRPFPKSGAYGHWTCERYKFHKGRHRYGNYTFPQIPRVWRLRRLYIAYKADRHPQSRVIGKSKLGYRRILFPTRYDPT